MCVCARMRSAWKGKSEEKAAIARLCAPPSLPHTKGPDRPPKGPLKKLQMRPPARLPFTLTAKTTNKASISIKENLQILAPHNLYRDRLKGVPCMQQLCVMLDEVVLRDARVEGEFYRDF